jgi:hypothetical protein
MFKDFHRRLQRDLKKIVDVRVRASNARLGGDAKVHMFSIRYPLLFLAAKRSHGTSLWFRNLGIKLNLLVSGPASRSQCG